MQNLKFVLIYSTLKLGEVAIIKSLLNATGIEYFVTNENFSTIYGPADGATMMDIMVVEDKSEEAKELLKDFISPKKRSDSE
jgi:hypothetical protein